jgi:hypothetical protein
MVKPRMNIEAARQTIANCISFRSCTCFDEILILQPFNFERSLDYVTVTKKNLHLYYCTLVKHINKDLFFNQNFYSTIPAGTLRKALDHHINTLNRFQRYLLPLLDTEYIIFGYDNKYLYVIDYLQTILRLTSAHESTITLFNNPDSRLSVKEILDEIDLHIYTLKLFEEVIWTLNNYRPDQSFFKIFRLKKYDADL